MNTRDERGAVAVLVAIVLAFVLVPLTALATGSYVRSTTVSELQRSADSGSLAAAAAIPLGDTDFLLNYLDATSGGATSRTLQDLGLDLSFGVPDPLTVACDLAEQNATSPKSLGTQFADNPTCSATYLPDASLLSSVSSCAGALTQSVGLGLVNQLLPSLGGLLPALLRPGVAVHMSWHVNGPLDNVFSGGGDEAQTVTSIARRRFKNVVVVPNATVPGTGQTINLNPTVGDTRNTILDVLGQEENLLRSTSRTAPCADVLSGARDDILDIVDPPGSGPDAQSLISDALSSQTPILTLVYGTTIPFLDFVPVCVAHSQTSNGFIGHTTNFGGCSVDAPGGFRASLRNS